MAISRRNVFKLGLSVAAASALVGCQSSGSCEAPIEGKDTLKHQVVIIGGGFGGLTVAKQLKKIDKNFDVLVIEKNDTFMSCPFSNTNLGKLKGINLGTFIFDYEQAVEKHGYKMLKSEVTGINRSAKTVTTAHGVVSYDYLVMSPGIEYDYKTQFPAWSHDKIAHIRRVAPAALMPGSEHVILERQLQNMEDGDVIITVPKGKFRCPPAPFERACMIASYMNKEDIKGKVIILNETGKIAKGAAFKETWKDLYRNRIVHKAGAKVTDVDPAAKTVTYSEGGATKNAKYEVLNLIAYNKANPVVEMSGVQTSKDMFGKVIMNGCSFATKSDANIFAVGDIVGHALPPSGQTANWAGIQCAKELAHKIHGKTFEHSVKTKTQKAGNVCFSMVGDKPEEGISVIHDFSWTGKVIKGKGHVPKDKATGKFRSKRTGKAAREWYRGVMRDLFA